MLSFILLSVSLVWKHKPFYSCHCYLRHITSQTKWTLSILFHFFCLWKPSWLTIFDWCNSGLAITCTVTLHRSICSLQPKLDVSLVGMIIDMTTLSLIISFQLRFDTTRLDHKCQPEGTKAVFRVCQAEQMVVTSVSTFWIYTKYTKNRLTVKNLFSGLGLRCLFGWISEESRWKSPCCKKLI